MKVETPVSILASHQKTGYREHEYRDWPKLIDISLIQNGDYVDVHVVMSEPTKSEMVVGVENRRAYWLTFLQEYWTFIGVELDRSDEQKLYSETYFEKEAKKRRDYSASIVFFFILYAFVLFFTPFGSSLVGASTFFIIFGIGYVAYQIWKLRKTRKQYREIYPNSIDIPGNKHWITMIILLVLMPTILGVLYYGNFGISTAKDYETYTDYGFSFEHPADIEFDDSGLGEMPPAGMSVGMIYAGKSRSFHHYELVYVLWNTDPFEYNLDSLAETLDYDVIELDTVREMIIDGNIVQYRTMKDDINDRLHFGAAGVWYCEQHDRLYWLIYYNTRNIALDVFMNMIDTFEYSSLTEIG